MSWNSCGKKNESTIFPKALKRSWGQLQNQSSLITRRAFENVIKIFEHMGTKNEVVIFDHITPIK